MSVENQFTNAFDLAFNYGVSKVDELGQTLFATPDLNNTPVGQFNQIAAQIFTQYDRLIRQSLADQDYETARRLFESACDRNNVIASLLDTYLFTTRKAVPDFALEAAPAMVHGMEIAGYYYQSENEEYIKIADNIVISQYLATKPDSAENKVAQSGLRKRMAYYKGVDMDRAEYIAVQLARYGMDSTDEEKANPHLDQEAYDFLIQRRDFYLVQGEISREAKISRSLYDFTTGSPEQKNLVDFNERQLDKAIAGKNLKKVAFYHSLLNSMDGKQAFEEKTAIFDKGCLAQAQLLYDQNELDQSEKVIFKRKYAYHNPQYWGMLNKIGNKLIEKKDAEKAEEFLRRKINSVDRFDSGRREKAGDFSQDMIALGKLYFEQQKYEQAIKVLVWKERFAEPYHCIREYNSPPVNQYLSEMANKLMDIGELDLVQKIQNIRYDGYTESSTEQGYRLAKLYQEKGEIPKAVAAAGQAIKRAESIFTGNQENYQARQKRGFMHLQEMADHAYASKDVDSLHYAVLEISLQSTPSQEAHYSGGKKWIPFVCGKDIVANYQDRLFESYREKHGLEWLAQNILSQECQNYKGKNDPASLSFHRLNIDLCSKLLQKTMDVYCGNQDIQGMELTADYMREGQKKGIYNGYNICTNKNDELSFAKIFLEKARPEKSFEILKSAYSHSRFSSELRQNRWVFISNIRQYCQQTGNFPLQKEIAEWQARTTFAEHKQEGYKILQDVREQQERSKGSDNVLNSFIQKMQPT